MQLCKKKPDCRPINKMEIWENEYLRRFNPFSAFLFSWPMLKTNHFSLFFQRSSSVESTSLDHLAANLLASPSAGGREWPPVLHKVHVMSLAKLPTGLPAALLQGPFSDHEFNDNRSCAAQKLCMTACWLQLHRAPTKIA